MSIKVNLASITKLFLFNWTVYLFTQKSDLKTINYKIESMKSFVSVKMPFCYCVLCKSLDLCRFRKIGASQSQCARSDTSRLSTTVNIDSSIMNLKIKSLSLSSAFEKIIHRKLRLIFTKGRTYKADIKPCKTS